MESRIPPILLVWDRIGDYHAARFLALEKKIGKKAFIADLGGRDKLYGWKNPLESHPHYFSLSDLPVEKADFWNRISGFYKIVKEKKIEVLGLAGYGRWEYRAILVICKYLNIKVVLFAESWYGKNKTLNLLKGKFLAWTCTGFLVSGQKALAHFSEKLGLPLPKIRMGYSVVDNVHFASHQQPEKENILLCVARFSEEKNLVRLIRAFQKSALSSNWNLKLVGGGPQKPELLKLAENYPHVQLSDWLSYQALPFLYGHARFFILPSTFEPWGLVVNEAMAAGLPIALSKNVGCFPDLLKNGNGFLFDAENEDSIKNCLNRINQLSQNEMEEMAEKSLTLIAEFSPEVWRERFLELVNL
jgi:glycosyltransferase involved in cell wall biosynthesis